jgi:dihydroorotate dehydrogenase (NAD+) catalytic subunit
MNTLTGLAIDVERKRPVLATTTGGLSGPAVRSIALRLVYAVAPLVDIPIIGIGGIGTTEDALMFLMAGATAIQVGTANFYNHRAPLEIISGLEDYCVREGLESIQAIIGAVQPQHAEISAT